MDARTERLRQPIFSVQVGPVLAARIAAYQKRRGISRGQAMRELMIAGVRHRELCKGRAIN